MTVRRSEHGAALILALVFLSLFGILISVVLGFTTDSVLATERLREQRSVVYAADGAMDGAIQYIRIDTARGAHGTSCPSFTATVDGVTATVTCTPAGLPDEVDRKVTFVSSVDGAARVTATVIYRDSTAQTSEPQVDVLSWTYMR